MRSEELERLGLYDPAAPDAAERLALLEQAFAHGGDVDEVRAAIAERRLHVLAAMLVARGGTQRLSLDEAADRAGLAPETARDVWRAYGFPDPGPGDRPCTELDVEPLAQFGAMRDLLGEDLALQLVRTTGSAMARVADAVVGVVRAGLEAPMRAGGRDDLAFAETLVILAREWIPAWDRTFAVVHRHHLFETGRRYALWGVDPSVASTTDAVVGFVDIVGYTALGHELSASELDRLVGEFEQLVLAAVARPGARLVKLIGDEAMFVAGTAGEALDIATLVVAAVAADRRMPSVRIGLAAGPILVREGDLFGATVNLAARLVAEAEPGTIVAGAELVRRLPEPAVARSRGTRTLAGFAEPVEVFVLSPG